MLVPPQMSFLKFLYALAAVVYQDPTAFIASLCTSVIAPCGLIPKLLLDWLPNSVYPTNGVMWYVRQRGARSAIGVRGGTHSEQLL